MQCITVVMQCITVVMQCITVVMHGITVVACQTLAHALVTFRLEYGSVPLHCLRNTVTHARKRERITPVLGSLRYLMANKAVQPV